jgi:predicted oxidoreductase (fatty acid repression mutant protein)
VATMPRPTELTTFSVDRFSPMHFSPDHVISDDEIDALLDAARRTPSAGNSQPWSFIVGRRGDEVHSRLLAHLAPSSSAWAPAASVLIANLAHRLVEGSELEYSEFAHYDVGQAVAHLSFQAHALNLSVHQFRAFNREGIAAEFAIPAHWEVTSLAAVGRPQGPVDSHSGTGTSRERRSLDAITWARVRAREAP